MRCWKELCGTYRPQPEEGHEGMAIGLKEYRNPGNPVQFAHTAVRSLVWLSHRCFLVLVLA